MRFILFFVPLFKATRFAFDDLQLGDGLEDYDDISDSADVTIDEKRSVFASPFQIQQEDEIISSVIRENRQDTNIPLRTLHAMVVERLVDAGFEPMNLANFTRRSRPFRRLHGMRTEIPYAINPNVLEWLSTLSDIEDCDSVFQQLENKFGEGSGIKKINLCRWLRNHQTDRTEHYIKRRNNDALKEKQNNIIRKHVLAQTPGSGGLYIPVMQEFESIGLEEMKPSTFRARVSEIKKAEGIKMGRPVKGRR